MNSRPLLKPVKRFRVILDSKTFDRLVREKNRCAIAILNHYDSDILDFIRTPFTTELKELQKLTQYEIEVAADSTIKGISIRRNTTEERRFFPYRQKDIEEIARVVLDKQNVTEEELNSVKIAFILAIIYDEAFGETGIYITDEKLLLKKRLWFESHFPGRPLNIMSIEEAYLFLDLFFKYNEKYFVRSRYTLNKGYRYWLSMRLKLPHYNVGDEMIDALAKRFYFALMALDEMGIQYYKGVNNDTIDNTLYHFNYLISLITGIFDNLALKTNKQLEINFSDLRKVSLHNVSGREFLRQIRGKRLDIRTHINCYVEFINLVYSFRAPVIHREGFSDVRFENREGWKAGFLKISPEIRSKLKACGDKENSLNPFTTWGAYQLGEQGFLDPYIFSIQAMKELPSFVDEYLKLLGYPSFIEITKSKTEEDKGYEFKKTLLEFEEYHLGF